ncbi:MAG: FUSC family protein [Coxiellaceae bacterium]|nr:FUSC family protein [Coxiellaceae bacterium]
MRKINGLLIVMDIIEQTFRQRACVESLKAAAAGVVCVMVSMVAHLEMSYMAPIICMAVRFIYRTYSWQRCLSGILAALIHMSVVLLIAYITAHQFSYMVIGFSLYLFTGAYLFALGKPVLETIFLTTFTPFVFLIVMTAPEQAVSAATYWFVQVTMGFLAMMVVGIFSASFPYQQPLERRSASLLQPIIKRLQMARQQWPLDNALFNKTMIQIKEIYAGNRDREIFWMSNLMWLRNLSGFSEKLSRCYCTIQHAPQLQHCFVLVQQIQHTLCQLLEATGKKVLLKPARYGYALFALKANLLAFAHAVDQLRDSPAWQQIPAKQQLVLGEFYAANKVIVNMLLEWMAFYLENNKSISHFVFNLPFKDFSRQKPALIYATKLVVAFLAGLMMYRYVYPVPPAQFIATVLIISIEINLVRSLRKALMRLGGSFVGLVLAVVGLMGYAHFSNVVWLWVFIFFIMYLSAYFCRPDAKYPYAGLMMTVMSLIIMLDGANLSVDVNLMINRSEGIFLGICLATFINLLYWPARPERHVMKKLSFAVQESSLLLQSVVSLGDGEMPTDLYRTRRLTIEGMLSGISVLLADYKSIVSQQQFDRLQALAEAAEFYYLAVNAMVLAFKWIPAVRRQRIVGLLSEFTQPLLQSYQYFSQSLYRYRLTPADFDKVLQMQHAIELEISSGELCQRIPESGTQARADYAMIIGHWMILVQKLVEAMRLLAQLNYREIITRDQASTKSADN